MKADNWQRLNLFKKKRFWNCNAFVTTWFDYYNSLYLAIFHSLLSHLQFLQNSTARLPTRTQKRDYITPVIFSLHWLPVYFIIHLKFYFVYKSLNSLDLSHPWSLRSADQLLLDAQLKLRQEEAFADAGPNLWNAFPLVMRKAHYFISFYI